MKGDAFLAFKVVGIRNLRDFIISLQAVTKMFESFPEAYKLLECDDDGNYVGIDQVWDMEQISPQRLRGVIHLAYNGSREIRFYSTLTLLEWYEPVGLEACQSLLDSQLLDEGPALFPHRLWGEDCAYEELAFRVVRPIDDWEIQKPLIRRFLSPEIYGKHAFLEGSFTRMLIPRKERPHTLHFQTLADDILSAMQAALDSKELEYPVFQASLCLRPLVAMGKVDHEGLEWFFNLPPQQPDPRFEAVSAARFLPDGGKALYDRWEKSSDPEVQQWVRMFRNH